MQNKLLKPSLRYLFALTILNTENPLKSVPDTAFPYPLQQLATHCEFLAFCVKPKPNKDEHSQQSSISTQLVSGQNTGLGLTSVRGPRFPPTTPFTVKSVIVQMSRRQCNGSHSNKKTVQTTKEEQQEPEKSQLGAISEVIIIIRVFFLY